MNSISTPSEPSKKEIEEERVMLRATLKKAIKDQVSILCTEVLLSDNFIPTPLYVAFGLNKKTLLLEAMEELIEEMKNE